MNSDNVEADERFLAAEHERSERAGDFGFAYTSGSKEQERPGRPGRWRGVAYGCVGPRALVSAPLSCRPLLLRASI